MGRNFKKKKNNLVVLTSYTLLFSTLVFISVISVIYKNTYEVSAQIDIQNFTPPTIPPSQSEPTQTAPQAPVYQRPPQNPQPNIPQTPVAKCVSKDELKNPKSLGDIIVGKRNGNFYAISRNDNPLTAERLSNRIDEIVDRTGVVQDANLRQSLGVVVTKEVRESLKGVLRSNQVLSDVKYSRSQNDEQCAVRITGITPTIFTYSQNTKVQPGAPILYIDDNNEYYYYEYDGTNISFNKPKQGWIVDKKNLKAFSKNISQILGLNPLESERLLFELNFSAVDVNSDKLFIGLIPQEEVDEQLPLKIESLNNPKVIRYHFYVAKAKSNNVKLPQLNPVQRDEFLILELGSWLEK